MGNPHQLKLRDIPRIILADSLLPLSVKEIWSEAVKRGLDKAVASNGKTPWDTIGAFLYTQAKIPGSGIVAESAKPVLFRAVAKTTSDIRHKVKHESQNEAKPADADNGDIATNSKFISRCLEVLKAHAPSPMKVGEIVKAILTAHPELPWKRSNGAIRAALIRAARIGKVVRQVADSVPPEFYIVEDKAKSEVAMPTASSVAIAPDETKSTAMTALSFLDCAEQVLREIAGKKPMHYRDITKKGLELGWLTSDGATPEATMAAQLATDIKKHLTASKKSRFIRQGRGYFGLSEWMDPIQIEIDRHNESVCAALLDKIRSMDAIAFEGLIGRLLEEMEFLDTKVTKASGDGGIDVRGTWKVADGILIKMAIQAKRWKKGHNVHSDVVDNVRGALDASERGMIITTSDFSRGARENADNPNKSSTISLVNGEQLVKLLVQYGIGIARKSVDILEADDNFPKAKD